MAWLKTFVKTNTQTIHLNLFHQTKKENSLYSPMTHSKHSQMLKSLLNRIVWWPAMLSSFPKYSLATDRHQQVWKPFLSPGTFCSLTNNTSQCSMPLEQSHSCYSIFKAVKVCIQVENSDLWFHQQDTTWEKSGRYR